MEGKTNPTERPPAREVLAAAADYYLVHSSDKMRCADAQLTALTAAGYPVEAICELEQSLREILYYEGGADNALEDEYVTTRAHAALGLVGALALAKEPQS